MPSVDLDYSAVKPILNNTVAGDDIITTPFGLTILELQGVLNLPKEAANNDNNAIKVEGTYDAVKFGKLHFDENNKSKVTLYIGNSQRLEGSIESLNPPLGVLKIPTPANSENADNEQNGPVSMIDIIKHKLVFRHRPLPIM